LGRSERLDHTFSHTTRQDRRAALPEALLSVSHHANYAYSRCDIGSAADILAALQALRPDRVIHLAGALRDEDWHTLLRANVEGTVNVLLAAATLEPKPEIVLGSTGSVYGVQPLPIREEVVPQPVGSYGTSKLMAELAAREVARETELELCIFRIFNLLGPGLQRRHFTAYFVEEIVEAEATFSHGAKIPVGDLNSIRDFVDVRDVSAAMVLAHPRELPHGVVNAASGIETPMMKIVRVICASSDCSVELLPAPTRSRPGAYRVRADTRRFDTLRARGERFSLVHSVRDMLDHERKVRGLWSSARLAGPAP
jgi:GDP-4-dehydro-6-deoxy-D-mannose reductase